MGKKQPIIFENTSKHEYVEGEQMMDLLLHYAQSGVLEAEKLIRKEPELFSDEDIEDFAANKVVLAKAPDILYEYKKKVREFERMHEKLHGVLDKCETIVHNYEERKHPQPKQATETEIDPDNKVIRYTEDGHVMMETRSAGRRQPKKVIIELKKSGDY